MFFPPFLITGFSIPKQLPEHRLKQMRRIGSAHGIFFLAGHCLWNQDAPQDVRRDMFPTNNTTWFLKTFQIQNKHHYIQCIERCDVKLYLEKKSHVLFKDSKTRVGSPLMKTPSLATFIALGPPKAPETKVYRWASETIHQFRLRWIHAFIRFTVFGFDLSASNLNNYLAVFQNKHRCKVHISVVIY